MDERTIGRLLREARQHAGFTLESLAEASGVSVRAISDIERGRSLPRQATLSELLDALELGEEQRRRLVRASMPRSQQVPQQLPPDLAVFRGRDEELTAVRKLTDQAATQGGHVVITAIGGMAGVGKTTLAVHAAHQVADRFPDGQLYVNLRGFQDAGKPMDTGEALGGFLRALGVPSDDIPPGTEQRSAVFRERTSSGRLIVVLDNARDVEQVRPLLPTSTGCLTVITSRNQLPGLAAADGASLISLDVWTEAEAVVALAARIGEERCRAEPEAAAELARLCGHLPVAVAVVGAQLSATPHMPLRVAVRELRDARLDSLAADDRRVDVRTVFSWSYRALTPETARVFRHLAIHPGPAVSAEAAASLANVAMPQTRRYLRELTSASLLSRDAEGRYVLHDLVRTYGTELVAQERDDRFAAETRLMDYLRHNAYEANRLISHYPSELSGSPAPGVVQVTFDNREEAMDWFRQEEATAPTALRTLDDPRLLRHRISLTQEWMPYNALAGRWAEDITAAHICLDAARTVDDPLAIARTCAYLARALVETGQADQADEPVDLLLAQLHRMPPEHQAHIERYAGWVRGHQGRHDEALGHARNALATARGIDQHLETGRSLTNVGGCLARLGDHREAIAACEEAVPILRRLGQRGFEAAAWDVDGSARQGLGDFHAAVASYRKALGIFQEIHDRYYQAETLNHLASAQLELGETEQARTSWNQAADLFTSLHVARAADMRAKAESLPRPGVHPAG